MSWRDHTLPFLCAAALTLLNAVKPAVVDDSAYLLFARHLADHPLDPYGFDLFWYSTPEPAMEILLPPVLPYWLSLGVRLFGEHLFLLKLWLFPFSWVLCVAARSLLRRFAAGHDRLGVVLLAFSPLVLPLYSFMLDVPAVAVGLAALAIFVKCCDGGRYGMAVASGVLVAVAMQTKYSMLVTPVVIGWYAVCEWVRTRDRRPLVAAAGTVLIAATLFAGWELFLLAKYGQSHFVYHVRSHSGADSDPTASGWANLLHGLRSRTAFAAPLLIQFGGLACGLSLVVARAAWWPRSVRITAAVLTAAAFVAICLLPYQYTLLRGGNNPLDVPSVVFFVMGLGVVYTFGLAVVRLVRGTGLSAETLFLVGWVLIEAVGMLGLTPFPAARRLVGVGVAFTVLAVHLLGRFAALGIPPVRWATAFAVGLSLFVYAIDCWDAFPEAVLAERAAEVADPQAGGTVWFTGHWGFQYYCDRAGMKPYLSGQTPLMAGDRMVLPLPPNPDEFIRPWPPDRRLPTPDMPLELLTTFEWRDWLSAQTVPNLYGGSVPLRGRDHPRLRVGVYRVTRDWRP